MLNKKNAHSYKYKYKKVWSLFACILVTALLLTACGSIGPAQPKTYTIGIARESHNQDAIFESFKTAMAELGYVEGKNITYISPDPMGSDLQKNETEIKNLIGQKVDMVLAMGTTPAKAAKKAVEGTNIPVVFVPVVNPVEEGIVASIGHPGGNLTGIQSVNNVPKALEWLLKIAPNTKQIYAPYSAADSVALTTIKPLPDVAKQLGITLILDPITNPDQEKDAIKALPKDSAIFFLPSPSLNTYAGEMKKLAMELGIPTGMRNPDVTDVVVSYTTDAVELGKQGATLTDKILKGTKPADLPVETTEFFLIINLKTAKAIGITIPDEILRLAHQIIR